MKTTRSFISLFLCFLMLVSSMTAFANQESIQNAENDTETLIPSAPAENVISKDLIIDDKHEEIIQLEPNDRHISMKADKMTIIHSSADEIKNSIISPLPFTIEGYVNQDGNAIELKQFYDFSKISKYNIAQWAAEMGAISEADKIECFCDLINSRNFENTICLEGIFSSITEYQNNHTVPMELQKKIKQVLTPLSHTSEDDNISLAAISSEATYSNTYFTIHYDKTKSNAASQAVAVASYLNEVRNAYLAMGFSEPILQTGESKYHVHLDPEASTTTTESGSTIKVNPTGNKCASYMVLYNFSTLTNDCKERIAHEYFHAIQNAYNHDSGWMKEAMAGWGGIMITQKSQLYNDAINKFMRDTVSMPKTDGYGAVVFPLSIHLNYGGANAIIAIYEEYETWASTSLTLAQERSVITNALANIGYSDGFDLAYRKMAAYLYNPAEEFSRVYSGSTAWSNLNIARHIHPSAGIILSLSDTIPYLSNAYHSLTLPSSIDGANVKVSVSFTHENAQLQRYKTSTTNSNYILYANASNNKVSYIDTFVGDTIEWGLIISNLDNSEALSYTIELTILPTDETMTITNTTRYTERSSYIMAGSYSDFYVTFDVAGSKMIQTMGSSDTRIYIYDNETNALVAYNDDGGYQNNAFIRTDFSANKCYRIRINLYNQTYEGMTKLVITPTKWMIQTGASAITTFEDIWTVTNQTNYTQQTSIVTNHVKAVVFKAPSSGYYTIQTTGSVDTFIYVINPESSSIITSSSYNDDLNPSVSSNAGLVKYLTKDTPYIIFYSAYDISSSTMTGTIYLKVTLSA